MDSKSRPLDPKDLSSPGLMPPLQEAWKSRGQDFVGDATGRKMALLLSALGQDGVGMAGNEGGSPGAEKATGLLTEWGTASIPALWQLTGDAVILTTRVNPSKRSHHTCPEM